MVNDMSEFIHQYNAQILPPIWQLLMQTADIYVKVVVNVNEDDEADEEEIANFTTLVQQLIEFIQSIVEKNRFRNTVKAVLTDIVYIAIVFMQIPEETLQFWTDDTDTYCDDYNFDNCDSTVRTTSNDILLNLSEEFSPKHLLPALSNAIERHINVAQAEKSAQNQNWWKIIESAVTAMGTLKQFVCDKLDESKFNLKQFLAFVKTQLGGGADGSGYQQDVSPFLHNKCLWVLARYSNASADVYDRQTLQAILDCITNNMQAEKALQLQVGALLAMCEVCQELKPASPEQRAMVVDKFPAFMNFIPVIAPNAKNNILTDLLMTIALVISVSGKGEVSLERLIIFFIFYFLVCSLRNRLRPPITAKSSRSRLRFSSRTTRIRSFCSNCKRFCRCSPPIQPQSDRCRRNWCPHW